MTDRNPFDTLRENPFEIAAEDRPDGDTRTEEEVLEDEATARIRQDRDDAAEAALAAIEKLRRSLDVAASEIRDAIETGVGRPSFFIPNPQYLVEVVEWGSKFESLWRSVGTLERSAR